MYEEQRMYGESPAYPVNSTEPVKQPQVHEAIHGLEAIVEQHLKMAAELEQRLSPVLRNEPVAADKPPQEMSTAVPIAGRIGDSTLRLNRLLDSYRSLLRRLEV
jgi:hypothetical protein